MVATVAIPFSFSMSRHKLLLFFSSLFFWFLSLPFFFLVFQFCSSPLLSFLLSVFFFRPFYFPSLFSPFPSIFYVCLSSSFCSLFHGLSPAFINRTLRTKKRTLRNMKQTFTTVTVVMETHHGAQGGFSSPWSGLLKKMNSVLWNDVVSFLNWYGELQFAP